MRSFADIAAQYPPQLQGFQRNILREYLQYKMLAAIFASPLGTKLSFIGGTALCLVYQNTRFSEDLDFDNFGMTEDEFAELAQVIARSFEKEGYEVETRNVHKGAFRSYIRFPHLLYKAGLSPIEEEKVLIQVDTAAHHFGYMPDTRVLNKFEVFTPVRVTPLNILLSQKIVAAVDRKTPKGRDFFDIVFLASKTQPNYAYLAEKMAVRNRVELRAQFLPRLENLDFAALAKDVQPFLFTPADSQRVLLFKEYFTQWLGE